jgi:substrate-binding family protein
LIFLRWFGFWGTPWSRLKNILKSENRPTAILGDIDWRSVEALKIIHELGLKVPDDISVMGIYNTPWSQHFNMTSVKSITVFFRVLCVRHTAVRREWCLECCGRRDPCVRGRRNRRHRQFR